MAHSQGHTHREEKASGRQQSSSSSTLGAAHTIILPRTPTAETSRKKLEKMRKNFHLSRALQPDPHPNPTPFRTTEQYYKRRLWEPDYSRGFGRHSIPPSATPSTPSSPPVQIEWRTPQRAHPIQAHIHTLPSSHASKPCHACPPRAAPQRICTFPKHYPGLIYLPSYLCQHQQADLVEDCLTNGLRKPNATNIDTHWQTPYEPGIYELYRTWLSTHPEDPEPETESQAQFILSPRTTPSPNPDPTQHGVWSPQGAAGPANSRRQKLDFEPITAQNFLVARNDRPKDDPAGSKTLEPTHVRDIWMNGKLRWCTIGWQYHWPTKTYHFEREPTPISDLVQSTCKTLVNHVVPWNMIEAEFEEDLGGDREHKKDSSLADRTKNYKPEAGVINFYQYRDALTAHIDHSEVSTDTPLVSLSVGQACMFLISPSRDEEPLAIKLESGDGLIMAGPSRRFFHGVPRIIEDSLPAWLQDPAEHHHPEQLPPWAQWFRKGGRINLNVRQVF